MRPTKLSLRKGKHGRRQSSVCAETRGRENILFAPCFPHHGSASESIGQAGGQGSALLAGGYRGAGEREGRVVIEEEGKGKFGVYSVVPLAGYDVIYFPVYFTPFFLCFCSGFDDQ